MITVGAMRLPQPELLDDLGAFLRGLEPDGGYWLTMRRLADHDHSGGVMGVPVAGAGGADVTLTGTEGVTVVESPPNTFALGLTASPDANNGLTVRANGLYAPTAASQGFLTQAAADARYEPLDTMYTKAESDARYALASALTALTARVAALETSVTALKPHVHELGTFGAGTLAPTGGIP